MKAFAIIWSGYGDEGKGLFTDFISSHHIRNNVIRFNGGAQAGHTVQTPDGKRHVFGHFGANSFLPNSKTILSRYFVINPLIFIKELNSILKFNSNPQVYSHKDAYITTPYDMLINQWLEYKRSHNKHGSCGLGFGQTIQRNEVDNVKFNLNDLYQNQIPIEDIILNFKQNVEQLELSDYLESNSFVLDNNFIHKFIEDCKTIKQSIQKIDHEILYFSKDETFVFEGAQGLMLDQDYGDFPHVTRSNTGSKNISEIINDTFITNLETIYATRTYTTKHGAGKLDNELSEKPYVGIIDKTNIPNEFQGHLRFSYLDINRLKNAIFWDQQFLNKDIENKFSIGISCLDQSPEVKVRYENNLRIIPNDSLKYILSDAAGTPQFYESFSPTRETIKSFNL